MNHRPTTDLGSETRRSAPTKSGSTAPVLLYMIGLDRARRLGVCPAPANDGDPPRSPSCSGASPRRSTSPSQGRGLGRTGVRGQQIGHFEIERLGDGVDRPERGVRRLPTLERGVRPDREARSVGDVLLAPLRFESRGPDILRKDSQKRREPHARRTRSSGNTHQAVCCLFFGPFRLSGGCESARTA